MGLGPAANHLCRDSTHILPYPVLIVVLHKFTLLIKCALRYFQHILKIELIYGENPAGNDYQRSIRLVQSDLLTVIHQPWIWIIGIFIAANLSLLTNFIQAKILKQLTLVLSSRHKTYVHTTTHSKASFLFRLAV